MRLIHNYCLCPRNFVPSFLHIGLNMLKLIHLRQRFRCVKVFLLPQLNANSSNGTIELRTIDELREKISIMPSEISKTPHSISRITLNAKALLIIGSENLVFFNRLKDVHQNFQLFIGKAKFARSHIYEIGGQCHKHVTLVGDTFLADTLIRGFLSYRLFPSLLPLDRIFEVFTPDNIVSSSNSLLLLDDENSIPEAPFWEERRLPYFVNMTRNWLC